MKETKFLMEEELNMLKARKTVLNGTVTVSGAKNSALRLLAASLLTEDKIELFNFPSGLLDIQLHIDMLNVLGKECLSTENYICINQTEKCVTELIWDKRSIRNTLLILGAVTAKYGHGKVPLPGGCKLGDRKFDLHIMLLQKLGARVWEEDGYLCAESNGKLKASNIFLPIRSTGATENSIICASLAIGTTRIFNPHIRPEIIDLIHLLKKMGAKITICGQDYIEVTGVDYLKGTKHTVIPDNMEALTWMIGAAVTNGEVEIENFPFHHLEVPLIHLRESGLKFFTGENSVIIKKSVPTSLDIATGPYPGINSDMQPLLAIYGCCAVGTTKITDLRFRRRYEYARELQKMGANSTMLDDTLIIHGGRKLNGAHVKATDLRAGIALLLAGFIASGETIIEDAWQIFRGYDRLEEKLVLLGADSFSELKLTL